MKDECKRVISESLRKNASDCNCPVPCHTIRYEPSLSYAQLSRQNTDRNLVPSDDRKLLIEVRIRVA